jgi:hypothetical protein
MRWEPAQVRAIDAAVEVIARWRDPTQGSLDEALHALHVELDALKRADIVVDTHGVTGYRDGCRCDVCREAKAAAAAEYRNRTAAQQRDRDDARTGKATSKT